ncbi:hypothetical protein EQ827_08430 [Lactobacillus bombi]|nr:hypothetical protein [Bombilactobacillus bombi]
MWVTKLVTGILMIIVSLFIFFQGTLMGIGNTIANNHHTSGTAGIFTALFYLVAGIVYLSTKKMHSLGGDIANCIILIITWLFAITNADKVFADLKIWGWLALIIGAGFLIWHIIDNKKNKS